MFKTSCSDVGFIVNCQLAASQGLCDKNQAASATIRIYCQKSCNLCPSVSCSSSVNVCNTGTCISTTYFNQPSAKCSCPSTTVGTYCTERIYLY